ncbi:UDP-glucose--hexose-1-phosphate uridylyltransferase [Paenibacillus sp. N1-5-1-14]|uniref:UDP-glucose--hexose-1-phosphate uridylyltransferase n=1 Tax=Paenibacillus radicibacter TaxID=2972488 RepID=UPI002158FA68|nr:UDP-glucose--hexose-1-phosphate uridylyltransferase [Paenibacillus radicibacter]MCR8642610.1 UDP-glucose--hexose-1-phosphate uridylyltransferase [Paenibacillus radicibacter]
MNDVIAGTHIAPNTAARALEGLLQYALGAGMIEPLDVCAARNSLLAELQLAAPYDPALDAQDHAGNAGWTMYQPLSENHWASVEGEAGSKVGTTGSQSAPSTASPNALLATLMDYAYQVGILPDNTTTYRDLLDAKLMGPLMPRPSEAAAKFQHIRATQGIKAATDYWYRLSIDSCYIRMDRIEKNIIWPAETEYGELEITINLSKPEKDPKEIAALAKAAQHTYPNCLLCVENVGYAGRLDHPARQNLRILPLTLSGEEWFFQYSPYMYYNEHSIVLNGLHVPMRITPQTFERLLDFTDEIPHYFIGSNADLPIVGGSILTHDHYQCGNHKFPLQKSPIERAYAHPNFPDVHGGIARWPMSVVRLASVDKSQLIQAAEHLLSAWRGYSDETAGVSAYSGDVPHNTITPISRKNEAGEYEMDLVLRNNRISEKHPEGIYHPHRNLHHIKKENIGLIEVMGLAVLPPRLHTELAAISELLTQPAVAVDQLPSAIMPHSTWMEELREIHGTIATIEQADAILKQSVGEKFMQVLHDAGVYKRNEAGQQAFERFLQASGYTAL